MLYSHAKKAKITINQNTSQFVAGGVGLKPFPAVANASKATHAPTMLSNIFIFPPVQYIVFPVPAIFLYSLCQFCQIFCIASYFSLKSFLYSVGQIRKIFFIGADISPYKVYRKSRKSNMYKYPYPYKHTYKYPYKNNRCYCCVVLDFIRINIRIIIRINHSVCFVINSSRALLIM